MSKTNRYKRLAVSGAKYVGIIVGTLAIFDLVTITRGLFPLTYRYGHPELGWVSAAPTGQMREDRCTEYSTGHMVLYTRNEDGVRTSFSAQRLREDGDILKIAVSGDSHTDICAPNAETHFGVLERELTATGVKTAVFAYGAGKYSPLQAYLAIKTALREYSAEALVLNFYTGNDFHDMLRFDDRPHFVPAGSGYEIAGPVWYQEDPPDVRRRSRVLFALRSIAQKTGIRHVFLRVRYLQAVAAVQGQDFRAVGKYMIDLRKSTAPEVGYRAAFTAQMLNQQLFFHHFPGSRDESLRRVRALLELVRRENPTLLLVMSTVPSYQLVQEQPVDEALLRTLERLPITYEDGVRGESELYETLRGFAAETGWLFVDNLGPLRDYLGPERLYNGFDYHVRPVASEMIGRNQAAAIAAHLRSGAFTSN